MSVFVLKIVDIKNCDPLVATSWILGKSRIPTVSNGWSCFIWLNYHPTP